MSADVGHHMSTRCSTRWTKKWTKGALGELELQDQAFLRR